MFQRIAAANFLDSVKLRKLVNNRKHNKHDHVGEVLGLCVVLILQLLDAFFANK